MDYKFCHVEQFDNGLWYVLFPDGSKAESQGFKTKGWATRYMNTLTFTSTKDTQR